MGVAAAAKEEREPHTNDYTPNFGARSHLAPGNTPQYAAMMSIARAPKWQDHAPARVARLRIRPRLRAREERRVESTATTAANSPIRGTSAHPPRSEERRGGEQRAAAGGGQA